jgi:hypothetical protein
MNTSSQLPPSTTDPLGLDKTNRPITPEPKASTVGRRSRRSTEISISGIDDSGTESDFARSTQKLKIDVVMDEEEGEKKKKKKRHKRTRIITAFSLTKYLNRIQVFPL